VADGALWLEERTKAVWRNIVSKARILHALLDPPVSEPWTERGCLSIWRVESGCRDNSFQLTLIRV